MACFTHVFFNISVLMKPEHLRPKEMEMNRPELPAFLIPPLRSSVLSCFAYDCFMSIVHFSQAFQILLHLQGDSIQREVRGGIFIPVNQPQLFLRLYLITILYKLNLRNTIL